MFSVIFSSDAEADYRESFSWYEQQQEGLGTRFENAVFSCLQKISDHPEHYGTMNGGLKKMLVPKFPLLHLKQIWKRLKFM